MMTEFKKIEGVIIGKKYKPGFRFRYGVTIPCIEQEEFALCLEHDNLNIPMVNSLMKLADEGKAPYCVTVGVTAGHIVMPNETERNMRMNTYDLFDREYSDFVVYELIPHIEKEYSVKFAASPDMHMVSGGSSGGISAFLIAWFHTEYFRRVYMSSPSFLAMARGNEIPYLIRKYETKPIRIYQEWSENEPNYYFGWSRSIDDESNAALIFAGYDYKSKYFPGEGHCSRYYNEQEAYIRLEWLWQDWDTKPIEAPKNSPLVDRVIPFGSKWEICDNMPENAVYEVPAVLGGYDRAVLSNDKMAWYGANIDDDMIYMYVNDENICEERRLLHNTLHTIPRYNPRGVIDMVVDGTDKLFALTAIGIQCVRSYGLSDVILDLPDDSKPLEINITDALYVKTEKGIYRRELCADCTDFTEPRRKFADYYD